MILKKFNLSLNYKINNYKKIITVDSDKSISIRSFLIGAISQNISIVKNSLESQDVLSTISCLKKLGIKINKFSFIFCYRNALSVPRSTICALSL